MRCLAPTPPISAQPPMATATEIWWLGAASMSRHPTVWRCSPPTPTLPPATKQASKAWHAPCPPPLPQTAWRMRLASPNLKRQPDGSFSAICSTMAVPPFAAKKVSAPGPTMSAKKTGCGRCCCGSTSLLCASNPWPMFWPNIGLVTGATTIPAMILRASPPQVPTL